MNAHFSLIITIFFCTLVFDINSKILQFKQNSNNISQVYIQEQNNEPKQLDEVQKEIGLYINENLEFNDNVKYVSAFVNPNLARLSQNDLSIGEGTKIIHQIISKSSKPKKSENRNEEKAQGFLSQSKRISASLN